MADSTFIVYCDESAKRGKHFSNFYGGVLINSKDKNDIEEFLQTKAAELNLGNELKWTKISSSYESKYIDFMSVFFDLVASGKIKIRIMFTHNAFQATNLDEYHHDNKYFILYYLFLKHAFGLQYVPPELGSSLKLITILDELPEKRDRCDDFKRYISSIAKLAEIKRRGWIIDELDIADVDSRKHVILQGLDVVLGAMQFRLNDLHREFPEGSRKRGKRTVAKENVYKFLSNRIRQIYPNFNIGVSTGTHNGYQDRWTHPYRHWCFQPSNRRRNPDHVPKKRAP